VLIGHDALALHILRSVDHSLELLDKNILKQSSMLFRRTLILGVVSKLGNGLFQLRPAMDERFELA
jgi:hypothetical protein